ncbi:CFEM-domain-containing protein [Lizonia empirigonia]|nr:CFEM-domain-containing protein [Lizonia empirigonia]
MKTFAVASIIALATVASAQLDNIPSCALNCFISPLTSDGCSSLTDFACHCKKGTELLATVQPCVKGACSADDQATTITAVEKTCQDAGVPLEIPDTSSAASSAASSATSAASSAASSAATSAISAASSAASSASSVVSEASSALESAASSMSSALSSVMSSAAASSTGASSNSASTTLSASPSQFTGAAAQATQAAGLLGAAALALFAL